MSNILLNESGEETVIEKCPCYKRQRLRNWSRLKGAKDTSQLNMVCGPALDPVLEGDIL